MSKSEEQEIDTEEWTLVVMARGNQTAGPFTRIGVVPRSCV